MAIALYNIIDNKLIVDYMNPKVSIITVVYNDVKNIEKSIQNTLSQTYQPMELIIVDGSSSDGTTEVIKKYDEYIKWVSEPDKGIYDAMNKGCQMATGEWVLFHNCGDFFLSKDSIKNFFAEYKDDKGEQFLLGMTRNLKKALYKDIKPSILTKHYFEGMPFCHPATFCRREWQVEHPFNVKYKNSADYDFCIRSLREGATFFFIEQPIVLFDCTDGTTVIHYDRTLRENIEIMKNHKASQHIIDNLKLSLRHVERINKLKKCFPFLSYLIELYHNHYSYLRAGWIKTDSDALVDIILDK